MNLKTTHTDKLFTVNAAIFHETKGILICDFTATLRTFKVEYTDLCTFIDVCIISQTSTERQRHRQQIRRRFRWTLCSTVYGRTAACRLWRWRTFTVFLPVSPKQITNRQHTSHIQINKTLSAEEQDSQDSREQFSVVFLRWFSLNCFTQRVYSIGVKWMWIIEIEQM